MQLRSIMFISALSATVLSAPAMAQDEPSRFALGVTGGTLGIGPEATVGLSKIFALRGNATFLGVSHNFDSDDINYDGNVDLQSFGLMVDLHPTGGGFHITGGVRINKNKAGLKATAPNGAEINGNNYTAAQIGTLTSGAEVDDVAPSLTIGYRKRSRGFSFGVEAGALFQGTVRIKPITQTGGSLTIPTADLEAERKSIQDDVDDYKVYPILQLSIGYRF